MGKTVGLVFPKKKAPEFVCTACGETFKSQKALDKHVSEKHPDTPSENGEAPQAVTSSERGQPNGTA